MKTSTLIGIIALLLCPFLIADGIAGQQNDATLENLIHEAITNNPELKSMMIKIESYKERPSQAGSLDDPRISIALMNVPVDTFSFDQEAMTQKQISVMQKLPFPGKLRLKTDIATIDVDVVNEEFSEERNSIVMQVKSTFFNLLFTRRAIDIAQRNRDLLKQLVTIAETRYSTGGGIQQDVLRAQVELSKMIDRIIVLEQKRKTIVARLNTLLGRPVDTPLVETGDLSQTSFNMTFEHLSEATEANRPMLLSLKHQLNRARLVRDLAKKDFYPDFDLGVSYGQREDSPQERPDFLSAFVAMNIPLWSRTNESRKVAEEEANIRRMTEQYASARNEIDFRIKELLTDIATYDQEIDLYRTGIIPQGTLSLESAMSAYTTNKVEFLSLISNQISLYNYEIEYARAITERETRLAELEAAVGIPLF